MSSAENKGADQQNRLKYTKHVHVPCIVVVRYNLFGIFYVSSTVLFPLYWYLTRYVEVLKYTATFNVIC